MKSRLIIKDQATIERANEIKQQILKEVNNNDTKIIEINVKELTEVDLSFLQLICATHKTCVKLNKELIVLTNDNTKEDEFVKVSKIAGFLRNKGCTNETSPTCPYAQIKEE